MLSQGPKLHIKLSRTVVRPVAVNATPGSINEAEVAIIRQAVEQCNWRIRGTNGAAALLMLTRPSSEAAGPSLAVLPGGAYVTWRGAF